MVRVRSVKESFLEELKRYVRFEAQDEKILQQLRPHVEPHFRRISDEFYTRLDEHAEARAVFSGPAQVERLKRSLCEWMQLLVTGPWDEAYYEKRCRIGDIHVHVALPQRYMFTAMNLIRNSLIQLAQTVYAEQD